MDVAKKAPDPMKILIVEDEAVIALCLEDILDSFGHEVCGIATTAEDAVKIADRQRPDLVLMDIMLAEGSDGVSAACDIRRRFDIGSVLTSALTEQSVRDRAAPAKPLAYVRKPYNPRDLAAVLQRVAA
jgi:CheY-like chemotaxis protein